jgi:hypothetical protein
MRFSGLLRGSDPKALDRFIADARRSRLPSMQVFARTLTRDSEAVKHAIEEPCSSGQAEGQINRLKTAQARHVWPRGNRTLEGTHAGAGSHKVTQNPVNGVPTPGLRSYIAQTFRLTPVHNAACRAMCRAGSQFRAKRTLYLLILMSFLVAYFGLLLLYVS